MMGYSREVLRLDFNIIIFMRCHYVSLFSRESLRFPRDLNVVHFDGCWVLRGSFLGEKDSLDVCGC